MSSVMKKVLALRMDYRTKYPFWVFIYLYTVPRCILTFLDKLKFAPAR